LCFARFYDDFCRHSARTRSGSFNPRPAFGFAGEITHRGPSAPATVLQMILDVVFVGRGTHTPVSVLLTNCPYFTTGRSCMFPVFVCFGGEYLHLLSDPFLIGFVLLGRFFPHRFWIKELILRAGLRASNVTV